jgi:hypothetical protein
LNAQAKPAAELQPPGAGLPLAELWLSRLGLAIIHRTTSRAQASDWFRTEADRILRLARSVDQELAARPVLIPRVWGIEDSSRNWSVFMTLEHLTIVNQVIADIIEHLAARQAYDRDISTADVKPTTGQDQKLIGRFAGSIDDYLARIERLENLHTQARHRHPWFGPLNAHAWHVLAAAHQRIHRRQIERILKTSTGR